MKKSPMTIVKERFGSKEELANKLIPRLDRLDADESSEDFERRLRTASNRKLLRLWEAEERVQKEFGSRDKLIDAIMTLKFAGKPEAAYRTRLERYAKTRLLELHAQLSRKASA